MVFISPTGDDSTATRGRIDLPALTLVKALALAIAGDTIFAFNGTYTLHEVNTLASGITLRGQSREGVSFVAGSGALHVLNVHGPANLYDLTLVGTGGQTPITVDLTASGPGRVVIRNVQTLGNQDGLITSGAVAIDLVVEDCFFDSYFDCMNLRAGTGNDCTYTIRNNYFLTRFQSGESAIKCVARILAGTVNLLNNQMTAMDGSSITECFSIEGAASIYVSNCGMIASTVNGGTVFKVIQSDGDITFDGCSIVAGDISASGGTYTILP